MSYVPGGGGGNVPPTQLTNLTDWNGQFDKDYVIHLSIIPPGLEMMI